MKTACVIGLGPAGITAVKELKELGFDVTGYDAGKRIGGRWALDFETSKHGAWKELYMNTARHINEFSDFPWKNDDYAETEGVEEGRHGLHPHSTEAYYYLKAYADHFGIMDSVVLDTRVQRIEKSGDDWIVHTEGNTKTFQFLVMAQGRYCKTFNPLVTNNGSLENFSGDVIHSGEFESVEMATGKRVLVVGSSVSGCDVAGTIARDGNAVSVDHSVRHVPYMINHLTDKGEVADEKMFVRLITWLATYLPENMNNRGLRGAVLDNFSKQVTEEISKSMDLVPDGDITKAGVAYSYNWVETLEAGKLALKREIRSSSKGNKTIVFEDGSEGEYDLVICATGYSMDLSLLPADVAEKIEYTHPRYHQKEVALYKWTLAPDLPTLAFCGAQHLIGSPFPCFEMNSRWIANVFLSTSDNSNTASLAKRPTEAAIAAAVAGFKKIREASAANNYDMAILATEAMAQEMGLAPTKLRCLWNPSRLLLSHPYASYYRTDSSKNDPETAAKASKRFEYLLANVPSGYSRSGPQKITG